MSSVIAIALFQNYLNGTLPVQLLTLPALQNLNIGQNFFHGKIPDVVESANSLTLFEASYNLFTGPIPEFPLFHMAELTLAFNYLSGKLPAVFFMNMSNIAMRNLNLQNNNLNGPSPTLSTFVDIEYFNIHGNSFTGSCFGPLLITGNLVILDVSRNYLSGQIPATFTTFKNLQVLNYAIIYLLKT